MTDIREARAEDAACPRVVMRRSISELRAADHGGDPAVLERWVALAGASQQADG